jgi:hypothetical protein
MVFQPQGSAEPVSEFLILLDVANLAVNPPVASGCKNNTISTIQPEVSNVARTNTSFVPLPLELNQLIVPNFP